MVRLVRPWYAWSNTTTAGRPVAWRAILTAFSTASAPELNSAARFSTTPGVNVINCSQTVTYDSYGATMKQVWVKRSTCSRTAATTRGAALPTLVTAMPEAKSIHSRPSTSRTMPPPALSTYDVTTELTPLATAAV